MSDPVEAILRGAGLSDKPWDFDSNIHSWRCERPDTYGECNCFQDLVKELTEEIRKAKEEAYEQGRIDERHDCQVTTDYLKLPLGQRDMVELQRNLRSANPHRKEKNE